MMNTPLLSVCLITYNHVEYIRQAIDSILIQKINFPIELIIADDFSTDGTREILLEYKEKYPEVIKLLLQKKNVGAAKNWLELLSIPIGKYIAYLEGDDYWCDQYKLQKQFDVLEANPDCVACHHSQSIIFLDADGTYKQRIGNAIGSIPKQKASVGDIFTFQMRPQSRTLLFRNNFSENILPEWFYKVQFGDLPLCLILGKYGNFYFLDEEMAVYRITGKGVSSTLNSYEGYIAGYKEWIKIWTYALNYCNYAYTQEALIGFNDFISRIIIHTNNSFKQRLKLIWFIFVKINLRLSIKKELIYSLLFKYDMKKVVVWGIKKNIKRFLPNKVILRIRKIREKKSQ